MFCLSLAAQFNQSRLPVSQSVQLCVKWAVSAEATSLADEHSWITSMTTSSTPMKTSAKVIKCHHVSFVSRLQGNLPSKSKTSINGCSQLDLPAEGFQKYTVLRTGLSSWSQDWNLERLPGFVFCWIFFHQVAWGNLLWWYHHFSAQRLKLICSKTTGESEWKSWFGAALVKYVQICPNWTSLHGDGNGNEYAASPSAVSNSSGAPEHWQDASYQPVVRQKIAAKCGSASPLPLAAQEKLWRNSVWEVRMGEPLTDPAHAGAPPPCMTKNGNRNPLYPAIGDQ